MYEAIYGPIVFLRAVYRQLIVLLSMFLSGAAIFGYFEHLPGQKPPAWTLLHISRCQ